MNLVVLYFLIYAFLAYFLITCLVFMRSKIKHEKELIKIQRILVDKIDVIIEEIKKNKTL